MTPPSPGDHPPRGLLRAVEDAGEVDVEHAPPVGLLDLEERLADRDAGVRDEHVDAAEQLVDARERGRDGAPRRRRRSAAPRVPAIRSAAVATSSSPTASATTRAPSSRKRRLVASPIPLVPPVTTTRLPSSPCMSRQSTRERLPAIGPGDVARRARLGDLRLQAPARRPGRVGHRRRADRRRRLSRRSRDRRRERDRLARDARPAPRAAARRRGRRRRARGSLRRVDDRGDHASCRRSRATRGGRRTSTAGRCSRRSQGSLARGDVPQHLRNATYAGWRRSAR